MNRPDPQLPPPIAKIDVLERIGGDPAFLAELLGMYDSEYMEKSVGLARAIKAKDFPEIFRLGHSLKGSSANLSLPGLCAAALAMETAGRTNDIGGADLALASLHREYKRLKDFLETA
jgi:HPt (histidine-containing phosphotransfer) domain-containing protein